MSPLSAGGSDLETAGSGARLLGEHDDGPERSASRGGTAMQGGKVAIYTLIHSWASRKFAVGCAILFPVAVTVYITWWFLNFFDGIFSPLYFSLFSFHVFGLGFVTSMLFIFFTGVFFSSWLGGALLGIGEWIIRRLPLIKHIYSASKQVSAALNPENETSQAFQECCIVRHPRHGEYALGFVTGRTMLRSPDAQDVNLLSIYVPTNHVYLGDVFLMEEKNIIKTNLSVRDGLEVVVSVGMAVPPTLIATTSTRV